MDNNFLIDYVPGYQSSLFVASGGSGHGFKFLPVLGKVSQISVTSLTPLISSTWLINSRGYQTNLPIFGNGVQFSRANMPMGSMKGNTPVEIWQVLKWQRNQIGFGPISGKKLDCDLA